MPPSKPTPVALTFKTGLAQHLHVYQFDQFCISQVTIKFIPTFENLWLGLNLPQGKILETLNLNFVQMQKVSFKAQS